MLEKSLFVLLAVTYTINFALELISLFEDYATMSQNEMILSTIFILAYPILIYFFIKVVFKHKYK